MPRFREQCSGFPTISFSGRRTMVHLWGLRDFRRPGDTSIDLRWSNRNTYVKAVPSIIVQQIIAVP